MKVVIFLCLVVGLGSCTKTRLTQSQKPEPASRTSPGTKREIRPLSEIDLSKTQHLGCKGRVQDKDYQDLDVADQLIAHGKDSIPYLISKLDDRTVIDHQVICFWPENRVADVAFVILSDFSLDSTWTTQTIPGTSWEEMFEAKKNTDDPYWEYYSRQMSKHERHWLKDKWQKIWQTYKDRIVWDEQERSFKVV